MPQHFCVCGREISGISQSPFCWQCKEERIQQRKLEQKQKSIQKQEAAAKAAAESGFVLVHACVGEFDPPRPCHCRKFVTVDEAFELFSKEGAIDFATRTRIYIRGNSLLEIGRRKHPPASTLGGGRVGIERKVRGGTDLTPDDLRRIQAVAAEDWEWRSLEERQKTEIEHELALASMRSIVVEVAADLWDAAELESRGIPVISLPAGHEDRGVVGRDVSPSTFEALNGNFVGSDCQLEIAEAEDAEAVEDSEEESEDEEIEEAA